MRYLIVTLLITFISINLTLAQQPQPDTSFLPAMRLIPGGTFMMGDSTSGVSDEKPVHAVTVSDFYLCESEITVAQFKAFADASGYRKKLTGYTRNFLDTVKNDQWPMIYVTWYDAWNMCVWLKETTGQAYRLPTEAEWEYAAGNGAKHTLYSWGNDAPSGRQGGNVADESVKKTHPYVTIVEGYDDGYPFLAPVKSFAPNAFGLYDMSGNVWEWCWDWKDSYPTGPQTNPTGPATGSLRVCRGGSCGSNAAYVRVARRDSSNPGDDYNALGFRLARTAP